MTALCVYCAEPATGEVIVEEATVRTIKGVKTIVHPERRAPICSSCSEVTRELAPPPDVARARRAAQTRRWQDAQQTLT